MLRSEITSENRVCTKPLRGGRYRVGLLRVA